MGIFTKYKGTLVTDYTQLKDGDIVSGHGVISYRSVRFKNAKVSVRDDREYADIKKVYIDNHLIGWYFSGEYWDGEFNKNFYNLTIFKVNKLLKQPSMANKLLAALKLNKDQRTLAKVGVYDENGNLTDDGKELLLNMLAKDNETKLVEMTKDLAKDKKKKCEDD